MIQVRITNVSHVPLSQAPTPPSDRIKLSLFDVFWVRFPPIQRLLFFDGSDGSNPPFPTLVHSLKSSLSQTLSKFYPLAGKLIELPATGDVEIDCSAVGAGVSFVEAEATGDFSRLAGNLDHDVESFRQLLPELDTRELPAPVFAVQVTKFCGGGVVIGASMHHAVVDGRAVWQFMEAWAACCRAAGGSSPEDRPTPLFDRAMIKYPRSDGIVRDALRWKPPPPPPHRPGQGRSKLARRTFAIDAQSIAALKERAVQRDGTRPPSTFVVLSALIWTAYVRSKSPNREEDACLGFFVDCRSRLDPPVPEQYFGNCVKKCDVSVRTADLLAEDGFARACSALRTYIAESESVKEPLKGCERWLMPSGPPPPMGSFVNMVASPRFRAYETDFGWGRPSRVELVSMNHGGEAVMVAARDGGGVQLSVALDPLEMERFAVEFAVGLRG